MLQALVLAVATACTGMDRIGYDSPYLTVEPPADGWRACIYDREPGGSWAIWMIGLHHQLSAPFCTAVHPDIEFGRIDVEHDAFCPSEPEQLEPVKIEVKQSL